MAQWLCIQNCGACCHLDPSDRPDLADYLTPAQLAQYLAMVGENGWCKHYDHDARICTIYADRPTFCRVRPDTFATLYDVTIEEFDAFAIDCCDQQITGVYGPSSPELERYAAATRAED
jgi:Fe-S-cluster containining protein